MSSSNNLWPLLEREALPKGLNWRELALRLGGRHPETFEELIGPAGLIDDELKALIRRGRRFERRFSYRIEAIKRYRDLTKCGLEEAVNHIKELEAVIDAEELELLNPPTEPNPFTTS